MDHGSSGMDMDMDMGSGSCKISMLWNWYTVDACFLSSSWHVTSKSQFAGSVIGICLLVMAIEGVRRLGREYDRRLLRSRNDAIENAQCGMGNVGSAGLMVPAQAAALYKTKTADGPVTAPPPSGGCASKKGGCGSKKTDAETDTDAAILATSVPEITSCCGGNKSSGGANTSASTPLKEKAFDMTPSAELGGFAQFGRSSGGGDGFAQMHCRPRVPKLPTWTQQLVRSFIYGSQFSAAFLVMLLGMYFNGFVLIAIFIGATLGYLVFGSDTVSAPEAAAKNESPCCC